jgi:cell division protease FtsH
MYLPAVDGTFQRDCSEKTAQEIDAEVKRILDQAYAEAKEILEQHCDQLHLVSEELLKSETLDAATFNRLIGREGVRRDESQIPVEAAPESLAKI